MNFDHRRFLVDKWGDPDRLAAWLKGYGEVVERATVNQWFRRGSVPSKWLSILTALLEVEAGKPVSTAEYIK